MHPASVVRQVMPDWETLHTRRKEQAVVLQRTAHTAVYVSLRERWNKVMTAVALVAALLYVVGRLLAFAPALHTLWTANGCTRWAATALYGAALPMYAPEQLAFDVPAALLLIWMLWQPYRGERRLLRALHEL